MTTDYSRKWWALAAIGSGTFMSTIDGSIVNIALNTIQETYNASLGDVEWVVLAYLLGIVCLLPSMGRLGDMIGRRRVYMGGFILFTAASALCGYAWDLPALIAFRVLQAIGAAMVQAMGIALLVQAFPASERGRALGYNGTIIATGVAAGPVLGGIIIATLGWRSIFYVNIPFGILALILSYYVLADDSKRTQQRFDYIGAALLGGALVSILYSLTEGQHTGFGTPLTLVLFFGGFVGLALFIWWERRIDYPMLNLQFFSNHNFSLGLVAASLQALTLQFNFVLLPLFMQKVLNFDTGKTGLLMVVSPIAISIFSMVSGRLTDRFGPRWIATAGIFFLGLGLYRVSGLTAESDVWDIVFRVFFIGTGFGLFNSANTSSVMGNVPREHGGIANGVLSVVRSTGQIAGVTLGAFIWSTQIFAQTGQAYVDFGEAPQAALVGGFQTTMLIAACLCWLALIPTLIRRDTTSA
jgi:EmrB/QacA subfamily drug resistance transporter